MSLWARALRAIIHLYQGWSRSRLPRCRYVPSCSEYAAEAIEVHGAWRGTGLALQRVGRCRPGGGLGADPVPEARRMPDTSDVLGRETQRVG